jgi:hypothetical protein
MRSKTLLVGRLRFCLKGIIVKRIMQWAGRNATMIALAVLGVWLLRALAYAAFWVVFFGLALAFAVGLFP